MKIHFIDESNDTDLILSILMYYSANLAKLKEFWLFKKPIHLIFWNRGSIYTILAVPTHKTFLPDIVRADRFSSCWLTTASSFFLCFPMAALLTPGEGHALRRYGAPQPSSRFTCKTRKEWGIWGSSVQDKSFFAAICQDLWSPSLPRDPPSKQTAG